MKCPVLLFLRFLLQCMKCPVLFFLGFLLQCMKCPVLLFPGFLLRCMKCPVLLFLRFLFFYFLLQCMKCPVLLSKLFLFLLFFLPFSALNSARTASRRNFVQTLSRRSCKGHLCYVFFIYLNFILFKILKKNEYKFCRSEERRVAQ